MLTKSSSNSLHENKLSEISAAEQSCTARFNLLVWVVKKTATLALIAALLLSCERDPGAISESGPFPWERYEAEDSLTNGEIRGPSHRYLTPESESSGRRHVRLEKIGDQVEFAARREADGLILRYCIPDSPHGGGISGSLQLLINGRPVTEIPLTSRHSWNYGDFPWPDDPQLGRSHHFFDETHVRIPTVRKGDSLVLRREKNDATEYVLVDFIELETVPPPLPKPAGSLSLADFGAVPGDGIDDSSALRKLLEAAIREGVVAWIPEGVFELSGDRIPLPGVEIRGAGMWHSRFGGSRPMFVGTGRTVTVSDIGIFGDTNIRNDSSPDNAFDGNFGDGSVFRRLWIEHLKCGFWTTGGTKNLLIEHCRLRNLMADGVNFCNGSSYSTVRECHVRNCGDDGLATWSPREGGEWIPAIGNKFLGNLVELQWHANGIAIYGGADHLVQGNTIIGTVFSGGGIHVASSFNCVPYSGPVHLIDNEVRDAGGDCYIGQRVGAVWVHAKDSDIETPIFIERLRVFDPQGPLLSIHGPASSRNVILERAELGAGAQEAIHILPNARGGIALSELEIPESGCAMLLNESDDFRVEEF